MVVFEKMCLNAQRMVLYVNNTREFYDIEEYLKERKQACAYLACTIINTAKYNLNLN